MPQLRGAEKLTIIEQWTAVAGTGLDAIRRLWKRGLEDWNVRQSQVANEWRADAVRADILRTLELRFGAPVPSDLAAAIEGVTRLADAKHWFDVPVIARS